MTRLRLCPPLMSDRESDIEFDFFEESDTRESAEERPRRRGPRPPVRPPTGLTPLLRLIGLISFAILIVLLLILWVNGCREDQRKDTYKNYVENVDKYAASSQQLGKSLNTLLTTPGTKEADVENELSGPRAAAGEAHRAGSEPRPAGPASQGARAHARLVRPQNERAERHGRRLRDDPREEGDSGRERAGRADATARGERRHLGGPLQGPDQEGAREPEHHRRQRAGLDLPREPRHRDLGFDEVRLAANPRRRDRRLDL